MKTLLFTTSLALLACACSEPASTSETPAAPEAATTLTVVARVGNAVLTEDEAYAEIAQLLPQIAEGMPLEAFLESPEGKAAYQRLLTRFMGEQFFRTVAANKGITVTPEDLEKQIAQFEAMSGATIETLAQFSGMTVEDMKRSLETELLAQRVLMTMVPEDIAPTDEEVQAEFATHAETIAALKATFDGYRQQALADATVFETLVAENSEVPSAVEIPDDSIGAEFPPNVASQIQATPEGGMTDVIMESGVIALIKVVKRTPATVADDAGTKAKLEAVRARILAGEDFATLAKEFSDCPSGARAGGDLGAFGKGQMVPEFEQAAFTQPVGEVGALVKTAFGYHIIKVTARDEAAGTVTASHILMKVEDAPATTELLLMLKDCPTLDIVTAQLKRKRQEEAYVSGMTELLKTIEIETPGDPTLAEKFRQIVLTP